MAVYHGREGRRGQRPCAERPEGCGQSEGQGGEEASIELDLGYK